MKKRILLFFVVAIATTCSIMFIRYKVIGPSFTVEWHPITLQTYEAMRPTFDVLHNVFVEAFVPLVKPDIYKHNPRLVNLPAEKRPFAEQKVVAGITTSLQSEWSKKIDRLYADLQSNRIPAAYVAIAKDCHHNVLGFALFVEESMQDNLDSRLLTVIEGSCDKITPLHSEHDEAFTSLLAIRPDAQQKGIGRALLFSILNYCPHIKKIYLTTSASDSNKRTQGFYEHVGFTRILKGMFAVSEDASDFERAGKIVYMYQKNSTLAHARKAAAK